MKDIFCFIINCASNAKRIEADFKKHADYLLSRFDSAEFIYVEEHQSIKEIAQKAAKYYDYVIACGGDGTVNQVAQGMAGSSATMGVLPFGSGNDFAKAIGLTEDVNHNISILHNKKTAQIDVIKTKQGIFLNTYGIGLDGLTNYYAAKFTFKRGSARYFVGGLKALCTAQPFEVDVEADGLNITKQSSWMVVIANGKTEGGKYAISPTSNNRDGIVEIVLVKDVSRIRLAYEFLKLSLGIPFNQKIVKHLNFTCHCFVKTNKRLKAHADGEIILDTNEFDFKVSKQALTVIIA